MRPDFFGSLLTKKHEIGMTMWTINLIWFGFAGVVMMCISAGMRCWKCNLKLKEARVKDRDVGCSGTPTQLETPTTAANTYSPPLSFQLPMLSRTGWLQILAGVFFVTFLCPTLSNHALFQISLGLSVLLSRIGLCTGCFLIGLSRVNVPRCPDVVGWCWSLPVLVY